MSFSSVRFYLVREWRWFCWALSYNFLLRSEPQRRVAFDEMNHPPQAH
ncbi:hypothetical protein [Amantichitinum ursilacus]|nr:hypothetical protein [Amantichitinum ursilacus]